MIEINASDFGLEEYENPYPRVCYGNLTNFTNNVIHEIIKYYDGYHMPYEHTHDGYDMSNEYIFLVEPIKNPYGL